MCGFTCELVGLRQSQLGVETTFKKHLLLFSISETRNKKISDYTFFDTIEFYFLSKEQMPSILRAPPIATGIINTLRKLASFCPVKHA